MRSLPEVNYLGRIVPQRQWRMASHAHDDHHQLIVVVSGTIQTELGGQTVGGGTGDVLFYPRGVPHAEKAVGTAALETFFVGFVEGNAGGIGMSSWPISAPDRRGRVQSLVRWMSELWPATTTGGRETLRALMLATMYEYSACSAGHESDLVARVRRFVHERLAQHITLDDLAACAALSRFHFSREFRAAAGQSPMRYVAKARVDAARTLLENSPMPLRRIAQLVGLGDEFQLSRVFKRLTGTSPGSVRTGAGRPGAWRPVKPG